MSKCECMALAKTKDVLHMACRRFSTSSNASPTENNDAVELQELYHTVRLPPILLHDITHHNQRCDPRQVASVWPECDGLTELVRVGMPLLTHEVAPAIHH